MGYEVDHSPRTSVDVSNECSHAGTPNVCLRDVGKENFTCFLPDNGRRQNTHTHTYDAALNVEWILVSSVAAMVSRR